MVRFPSGEEIADRFGQIGLVIFHRQHVIGLLVPDHCRDGRMGARSVYGDDGALDRQRLQQQRYGGDFVGFLRSGFLPQHHAHTSGQRADQVQWPTRLAPATSAGLAVHRHHGARFQHRSQPRYPAPETGLHRTCIEHAEDPPEGVVRGYAMFQFHKPPQPIQPCLGPGVNVHKIVSATQHRAHRNHQHFHQIVRVAPSHAWIDYDRERFGKTHRLFCLHRHSKKTENYTALRKSTSL